MVRIVDNPCSCGRGFTFEGTRRDERVARAAWDMDHAFCGSAAPVEDFGLGLGALMEELHAIEEAAPEEAVEVEVHRDASSGEFVTAEFADEHPATTVEETVERPARRRR